MISLTLDYKRFPHPELDSSYLLKSLHAFAVFLSKDSNSTIKIAPSFHMMAITNRTQNIQTFKFRFKPIFIQTQSHHYNFQMLIKNGR